MLEHSAMYLNVTPPYEEDSSFFPDFYTRVGSCELQDPVWAKMNALTGGVKQKRKKSENKPQTQINKCNNEKRRREQENIYIEELAELISANFADMSSLAVKPDKCAILQETVNQIRRIKQQDTVNPQIVDPVQQGEVSSSRPTILSNDVYGPLLLEALEGFLFVINSEGKVEHVTENVSTYIKFTKDEIIGKSIYNFMHLGDHHKFHSNLLPMTIDWDVDQQTTAIRSKSIDVRLLMKCEDLEETVDEKNQRIPLYESMHISSTQLRDSISVSEDDGSDSGPCLLCVASRISQRERTYSGFEQFTTKLDISGKILCIDTTSVSDKVSKVMRKDVKGCALRDLVPAQDTHKVEAHLNETLNAGSSVSTVYRIQIVPDKLVTVQTKSKLFSNPNSNSNSDLDFIMSTHSIITDNDILDPGGGGGTGDPLMTSVANGSTTPSRNGPLSISDNQPPSSAGSNATMMQTNSSNGPYTPEFLDNEFNLDFPSTTWDLEPPWNDSTRPSSRQSLTPVSTPSSRPPSNPSYSNAPTIVQSPMSHYPAQQSPANQSKSSQQNQTNNFISFDGMMGEFQDQCGMFPVEERKETTKVMEETVSHVDAGRLRDLLTNPLTSSTTNSSSIITPSIPEDKGNRILKELLNQPDEESTEPIGPCRLIGRSSASELPKSSASSSTGNNNMLRKLLNDKQDDDDIEAKTGMKKNYELLQQLLKKDSDEDDEKKNENNPNEDALLRNLGFHCGSSDRRGSKRSIDDKDDRDNKRSNSGSQVSSSGSSGKSEIYQKNKMLAFLLETPTPTPPTIPPIPASVISATPQEKLPRVMSDTPNKLMCATMAQNNIRHNNNNNNNNNTNNNNNNRIISVRQQVNYLNNNNNNNNNFPRPVVSSLYNNNNNNNQIPPSAVENNLLCGDNNNIQGDPDLSDILDTVLDYFVPDSGTLQLLDANEGHPTNSSQLSEMAAIKNIQNSLMQCEKAVPSPNVSLPARPPAYNANVNVSTQNNNSGYPPPPTYPQQIKYSRAMRGSTGGQYSANLSNNPQLLVEQHRKLQRHAEEQRRRLLQQQKQQQLLIPSNATADMNSIQNIDNLLNNTVAPNVTLQRSNSVPESQLSPNYSNQLQNANSLNQNNQRGVPQPNSSQPYSPHAQMSSPLGQQNFQNQSANTGGNFNQQQRLSPQSQFNSQLSPRQTYSGQGNNGNSGNNANNWPQQQQQRLTVQNPMLNAQLTGTLIGRGNFQRPPSQQSQQQRNLSSPGGARHSPYGGDQFAPPTSPSGAFTQTQYLHRLQRANSVPTTSSPMPGGLGSPRPYPGNQNNNSPHHYSSNNPLQQQIIPSSNNPMMYASSHQSASQESNYNCYDQQQQQHQQQQHQQNMSGYERRSSVPSAHHLPAGVAGSNPTSEFVRQELRAVVGARTAQAQPGAGGQQQQQRSGPSPAQQLQQISQQASNTVDLESLGINFEMAPGASDSPKLWGSIGTEMGSMSPQPPTSRTTMEEGRQGDHAKTSLLQQLLSDQSK